MYDNERKSKRIWTVPQTEHIIKWLAKAASSKNEVITKLNKTEQTRDTKRDETKSTTQYKAVEHSNEENK